MGRQRKGDAMASRFLYLVRHGEAAEGGGLTDAGEEQARRTGERLKNLPVDRVHHSPLPRAAHLPDQLRWTGFPAQLRPACG
jgi:probable phosphoglycerate mutase